MELPRADGAGTCVSMMGDGTQKHGMFGGVCDISFFVEAMYGGAVWGGVGGGRRHSHIAAVRIVVGCTAVGRMSAGCTIAGGINAGCRVVGCRVVGMQGCRPQPAGAQGKDTSSVTPAAA